jgi:hypothetical protein
VLFGFVKSKTFVQTFLDMLMDIHRWRSLRVRPLISPSTSSDFDFYDWVSSRSNAGLGEVRLGHWLGVSHRVGRLMSYWILPESGIPISATTVQRLTNAERAADEFKSRMREFEKKFKVVFDSQSADITQTLVRHIDSHEIIDRDNEDPDFFNDFTQIIDDAALTHADSDENVVNSFEVGSDQFIGMELALPQGDNGEMLHARVTKRIRDSEGLPIGTASENPFLDSQKYDIDEFADGNLEELPANIMAENLIAQVEEEGRRQMMLDKIIDHRSNQDAVSKAEETYVNQYGVSRQKQTTQGWEVLIQWKDSSMDWVALKDLKESYPVELALYATNRGIGDEPTVAWWVPYVLKSKSVSFRKSSQSIGLAQTIIV